MMDPNKWVNTLPNSGEIIDKKKYELNPYRWIGTLPKKSTNNIFTKYTLITILFVVGLISVSIIKNATKDIQKDVDNLRASITLIKLNLHEATLDHEVITSPENISRLAKEYLDTDFISYKKSQIRQLNEDTKTVIKINKKDNNLSTKIKSGITKQIAKKKTEIRKLQELYSKPKALPSEIKKQVAMKIEKKKIELKNIYNEPKDIFTLERVGRWSVVQVVKLFLGMPIIPGR